MQFCIACLLVIATSVDTFAQNSSDNISNLRKKRIAVNYPIMIIDSNSIVPNTFFIVNVSANAYTLDAINAKLTWKEKPTADTIEVYYRVFATKLNAKLQAMDYELVRNRFKAENALAVITTKTIDNPFLNFGGLKTDGSFGRALSLGNNQDAVFNSTFNLQMSGFIADSIEITAAVTDNNIPIQPDGNTQNLRDFDRIFFQAKKKNWQIDLGDINISQNKNYLLNFNKRVQGISAIVKTRLGKNVTNEVQVSGAVAKGKYTKNIITPLEGNQGPYRLQGANNEFYFVILANTERVFIDGVLKKRGDDEDYIINYNTAELTFTPKNLISKDSRLQIEFEYSDRNYLNAQIFFQDEIKIKDKVSITLGAYSTSDSKNSSIDQDLDPDQKQFLFNLGDSINKAFYTVATKDTIGLGKILYRKVDSTIMPNVYPNVYVLSNNAAVDLYTLSFSNLGFGKGNYVQLQNASNGKSFKWLEPVNGIPQGDWEPVVLLVTPKKTQIYNVGISYAISKNTKLKTEVAISNYDINLFSSKDKKDNYGTAAKFDLENNNTKVNLFKKKLLLHTSIGNEYVQGRYKSLEVLRNIEFLRDWSLPFNTLPATENISKFQAKLMKDENNLVQINVANYNRNDGYNGIRQSVLSNFIVKNFAINSGISYLNFSATKQKGSFIRPMFSVNKVIEKFKSLQVGYRYTGEFNSVIDKQPDSLNGSSFGFNIHEFFVKSNAIKEDKWSITFMKRNDLLPSKKILQQVNNSNNLNVTTTLVSNDKHKFIFSGTYRSLHVADTILSKVKEDKTLLARAEYFVNEMKGFINGSILYEVGAGQEQKREYTYVEVQQGQGFYSWIDYNSNGIQELNEFEEAIFPDQKRYIRIFTPSNQYVKANYLQFNYSIDLEPSTILDTKNKSTINTILLRSNTSSSLQINSKQIAANDFLFNPFQRNIVDTTLITLNYFFTNSYFYNRTSSKFGLEFTHSKSAIKSILSFGFESRNLRTILTKLRAGINRNFVASLTLKQLKNELATQALKFENRNYNVLQNIIEPSITYNYKSNIRATVSYAYTNKINRIDLKEKAISNSLNAEVKYNILSGSSIAGKFTYSDIVFNGPSSSKNSTVGYLLLDALQPGKNLLWNIDFTKRIGRGAEISFQYDGRKPASTKVIHLGRASLRFIF
jgi:hypothetical protein